MSCLFIWRLPGFGWPFTTPVLTNLELNYDPSSTDHFLTIDSSGISGSEH